MVRTAVIERVCGQRTNDATTKEQVEFILGRALGSTRGNHWSYKLKDYNVNDNPKGYRFTQKIEFTFTGRKGEEKHWGDVLFWIAKAGCQAKFNKYPWKLISPQIDEVGNVTEETLVDETPPAKTTISITQTDPKDKDIKNYGTLNLERNGFFDDIYDREAQIDQIYSAVLALCESDLQNRFHCVLYGPPGCGKTTILERFGAMLGPELEAYFKFDATSTTEAGAQKILLDSSYIPPVLIVEEIEKTDEKSLRWLLGVLDHRAEVRKTNYRIGQRARNIKMLCLATVNDIALFQRAMDGALHSRFAHEIYCPRPSRTVMQSILEREIRKVNGRFEWVEPTLNFCMDVLELDDPRKVVPVCLCGRDRLLDGSYQIGTLVKTMSPSLKEKFERNKERFTFA